jgi:hypothetical protein
MGIITFVIVASIATPVLGGALLLTELYLRYCKTKEEYECYEDDLVYVELPMSRQKDVVEYPKSRTAFLNKTLFNAATFNCPILCELLIEKGANELDKALEIAVVNGNIDVCKTIIRCSTCDVHKALKTAKTLSKKTIETYLVEHIKAQQTKKHI